MYWSKSASTQGQKRTESEGAFSPLSPPLCSLFGPPWSLRLVEEEGEKENGEGILVGEGMLVGE